MSASSQNFPSALAEDVDSLPTAEFDLSGDDAADQSHSDDPPSTEPPATRSIITYHAFYLGLSLVVLTLAFTMKSVGPSEVFLPGMGIPLPELCMSKAALKISCPGCGMTRGFISIAHGQWARAWTFNPASYFVFVFIAAQIPWRVWQIVRICKGQVEISAKIFTIPIALMCVFLFAQWLVRFFV